MRTLITLELIFAAACFSASVAPGTQHDFVGLGITYGCVLVGTAAGLWLFAFHLGRFALPAASLVTVAITSAIVSWARTPEGAVLVCFTYLWMAIYAASFFTARALIVVLAAIAVGSSSALSTNGLASWVGIWTLLIVTTCSVAILLEHSVGRLRREAETDSLTGLLNRRGFLKAAGLERSVSDRVGLPLAVVVLDLDHFKEVNDEGGHSAGDRVLVEATAAWTEQMRDGDLLARFGGDEFVMLLSNLSDDTAEIVLERLRDAYELSWTAGVSSVLPGEDLESAIKNADAQLYQNKLRREQGVSNRTVAS